METRSLEDEFRLEDQLNKCRCCLRTLIDEQKFVKVTKAIEKKFFDLTQIQLVESEVLSSNICQLCSNDLEVFSQFRKDLTAKQNILYRALEIQCPDYSASVFNPVKSEINEFIACDQRTAISNKNEEVLQPQVIIKSEEIENEDLDEDYFESLDTPIEEPELLRCGSCRFQTRNSKTLREHTKNSHNAEFRCDICRFYAHDKDQIERHMERSHTAENDKPQNFYCEYCSQEFEKRHLLNRHIKLKHTEKERLHHCPTCDKSFFTLSTLKKHVESHRAKEMPCEFCGKLFSCMNNLRTHLYYHSEPKFICEFEGCDKKFFMRKLLKAHMNVHRGQKDFVCSYCEKSYFFQSHLKRHIISTHMKLKIDCEVVACSSSFARKETYRNHVLQHHKNLGPEGLEILLAKIRNMKVEEFRCVG